MEDWEKPQHLPFNTLNQVRHRQSQTSSRILNLLSFWTYPRHGITVIQPTNFPNRLISKDPKSPGNPNFTWDLSPCLAIQYKVFRCNPLPRAGRMPFQVIAGYIITVHLQHAKTQLHTPQDVGVRPTRTYHSLHLILPILESFSPASTIKVPQSYISGWCLGSI